ncbi:hypothetical protein [Paraburkholderia sp. BL21I4N1]|uniref:hypothetical protein n=1 Tax=Paraburkholderia sp. BL21I4N1 TaxID=1938801 RepID=UPI000CFBF92A|nr:hypothetical protein [Paraburkholderia sp. BL21I4N1]PQV45823.1 hypothetical protein B0G83_11561 [Paraburkholderia sp. BL21I4N1]
MVQTSLFLLLPYALSALLSIAGSMALYASTPALTQCLDVVLTEHTLMFGSWLALAAAGADYTLTTLYRKLRMREVGAKSAAQLHLSGN